jgi:ferrochelatase
MNEKKIGLLLVNTGTPDSHNPKDVRRYLTEFLTDERIIDLPWLKRNLLVRCAIIPGRYKQSAESYRKIWTQNGSPLLVHSNRVKQLLKEKLPDNCVVELGMRYGNPSINTAVSNLMQEGIDELIVLPLFPQYASATTGSVFQKVMEVLSPLQVLPKLTFINEFATHRGFIRPFVEIGHTYPLHDYDHILFSFHGLPESQIRKADNCNYCLEKNDCCRRINDSNKNCYSAQCHATMVAIANGLGLVPDQYSLCFQSRLGKEPWLQPYASDVIHNLAKEDCRKVLVFCPSFVSDCLETIYEYGVEYNQEFKAAGGDRLDLVQGLNDSPAWIEGLCEILETHNSLVKGVPF